MRKRETGPHPCHGTPSDKKIKRMKIHKKTKQIKR